MRGSPWCYALQNWLLVSICFKIKCFNPSEKDTSVNQPSQIWCQMGLSKNWCIPKTGSFPANNNHSWLAKGCLGVPLFIRTTPKSKCSKPPPRTHRAALADCITSLALRQSRWHTSMHLIRAKRYPTANKKRKYNKRLATSRSFKCSGVLVIFCILVIGWKRLHALPASSSIPGWFVIGSYRFIFNDQSPLYSALVAQVIALPVVS